MFSPSLSPIRERPKSVEGYLPLFSSGVEALSQRVAADEWGNSSVSSMNISMYSLAQCHGDLSHDDCLKCFEASRRSLPQCLPASGGRVFLDGCFLRYDGYAFFGESVDPLLDAVNCNSTAANSKLPEDQFRRSVAELVDRVTAGAAADGRFATKGRGGVYGLGQCWNSVGAEGCRACLAKANREIRNCLPSSEGRVLNAGCYLRYLTQKFFFNHTGGSL